jgi:hypothetical protein
MECDTGALRAYRDGELDEAQRTALEAHLRFCPECRQELATARAETQLLAVSLPSLDPQPDELSDTAVAWSEFQARRQAQRIGPLAQFWEEIIMKSNTVWSSKWRPALIAATCLLVIAFSLSFAPVREAAAEFLGVFRVRKFSAIPVDVTKMAEIEGLEDLLESGVLGTPTLLREPGETLTASTVAEASELAGFDVRAPSRLESGLTLSKIEVASGPAMALTMDGATAEMVAEAIGAGAIDLPDGPLDFQVDFGAMVMQLYENGPMRLEVHQMPTPEVLLPDGLDTVALGAAYLRLLGMSEADATRLAKSVDWTSTLVIPVPTDRATYKEVEVNGAMGLAVETRLDNGRRAGAVIWERDGFVFGVSMREVPTGDWLFIADSLE